MTIASDGCVPDQAVDRAVRFRVAFNVRDLGGLPTADGRTVRRGRIFRGDGVHRLRDADLDTARGLGLRTVIDLRTAGEIERSGSFPVELLPVAWHALPILQRMWSDDDLVPTAGAAAEFLRVRYVAMIEQGAESLHRIVRIAAEDQPVLFHCAAGKDRTGVVAALLLGLVGVERDAIVADYHATADAMAAFVDWFVTQHPEARDAMTSQPPEYLEAPAEAMAGFLDTVDDRFGSMEGLADHLGVDAATVAQLRASLLD